MIGPDFNAIEAANQGFNIRQKLVLLVMDILLLAELTFCLWLAFQNPDNLTITFLKYYLPLFLVTLAGGIFFARRYRDRPAARPQSGHLLEDI
ncbi:MAG: hypothetical protein PHX58_13985 [Desulfovibrio sp.]|jgi:hypothetical protein|nr:hypothetical protein [Desulfovibrio sp.]